LNATVTTKYGPPPEVLQLRKVAAPEPTDTEVLIKLYASSVNPLDGFTIRGPLSFFPKLGKLLKPKHKIAGADFAGRVESVGRHINKERQENEHIQCALKQVRSLLYLFHHGRCPTRDTRMMVDIRPPIVKDAI
jgi:NADPH:quinone reductase-like Zn-dependent oxidoreductase